MEAGCGVCGVRRSDCFFGCFRDFPDPRQRGKVIYPLQEVLLLCLLAVLAGAETFVDIARFGQKKIAFLRRFLAVPRWDAVTRPPRRHFRDARRHGIPASLSSPGSPS